MSDLKLVPANELLDELMSRFDDAVFKGRRKETVNASTHVAMYDWRGEHAICLGLCDEIAHDIHKHRDDTVQKEEGLP